MGKPIKIDWSELLVDRGRDDRVDVCFATPPPTAARARAGSARGKQRRDSPWPSSRQTRFEGRHRDSGAGQRSLSAVRESRVGTSAASKAADDVGSNARTAALKTFDWSVEDSDTERASRRFCVKKSPIQSGKKNYGQLEMNSGGRLRHGVGGRKPIPVDRMYSSKPCSASFSGNQQRVHAISPQEVDHENFQQTQDHSFSSFAKRRKEQHQGSSSSYIQKVQDVVLLDDEEMQPAEKVDCGSPDKQIESKVYYPSRDDPHAVELSISDIRCLEPGEYLSSPVINYYIQAHWSLIIICIPGKESDSGPIILHLDSLGMHSNTLEEWRHLKKNPPCDTSISDSVWEDLPRNIHTQIVEVPQQNNAYDCGVFMLYYITRFVRQAPESFTRDKLGMFSRSWFKSEDASELRARIRELLLEEFESAWLDDSISDAASSDSSDKDVIPSDISEMAVVCVDSGDSSKNNQCLSVADAEGSAESGGTDKSNVGIAEVPAVDEGPTGRIRHDENVDCVLSEAATFSDGIKDEEYFCSDSPKAEEELAIVSPDRLKSRGGTITTLPYRTSPACSDSSKAEEEELGIVSPDRLKSCGETIATLPYRTSPAYSDSSKAEEEEELAIVSPDKWKSCGGTITTLPYRTSPTYSDSSKAEEELAIVSPERLKSREGTITSMPYREIVSDSDSDGVPVVKVRERRATRQNCLII
ncbi:hypothetical protein PR202_gb24207 [Eleusine coracana subsp. coracana]|uniref:Ubiquitin-like protease family profile domain-containing protein n=1 Tax=Eleusine coracana subsp. coracana TaxID=191504 RepID=A0AAV5FLY9_ELECO|nr:hypothetical protein PR202_gb24207 [Eleusine coracana subsp. coracana]